MLRNKNSGAGFTPLENTSRLATGAGGSIRVWGLMPRASSLTGFTLIELLLYVGLISSIILAVSMFLFVMLQARVKNQTMAEVEQQGLQAMQIITQIIRNANAINSPTTGASAVSLSLAVVAPNNPTAIDVSSGVLQITEGPNPAVALTNNRVIVSGLTFQNFSRPSTPGTIRISFTLTHVNSNNRSEYNFSKIFYGSGTLRFP